MEPLLNGLARCQNQTRELSRRHHRPPLYDRRWSNRNHSRPPSLDRSPVAGPLAAPTSPHIRLRRRADRQRDDRLSRRGGVPGGARHRGFRTKRCIDRYLGISMATMLADLEARLDRRLPALPPEFADTLRRRVAAAFDAELRPMPGIEAVLQALPHRRCVASSSAPERLRHSLALTRLLHHFDPHVFSATQVAAASPPPICSCSPRNGWE